MKPLVSSIKQIDTSINALAPLLKPLKSLMKSVDSSVIYKTTGLTYEI